MGFRPQEVFARINTFPNDTMLVEFARQHVICDVMHRWSHALAKPQQSSPQTEMFILLPKTKSQSSNGQFLDIPCLPIGSVFTDRFRNSVCDSVIAKII